MSFYVRREHDDGRAGWTGPIRSARQVEREAQAWRSVGWRANVVESSPEVRKSIREWEKAR